MVRCHCGENAVHVTSWTELNPGRRFWSCPTPGSMCGFVGWFDPPMCDQSRVVIPGLLRSMNRLRESLNQLQASYLRKEKEVKLLKLVLLTSWVVFGIFYLGGM